MYDFYSRGEKYRERTSKRSGRLSFTDTIQLSTYKRNPGYALESFVRPDVEPELASFCVSRYVFVQCCHYVFVEAEFLTEQTAALSCL